MTTPAQPEPTQTTTVPPAPTTTTTPPPARTFTQDEVNAVAAREAAEAKRQATKEVADRLGVSVEDAERIIKEHQDRESAALTEAERREREAEARERAAAEREAAAVRRERDARVRAALLSGDKPCRPERVDMAVPAITIADDADDTALSAAVDEYREKVPEFFTQVSQQQQQTPPGTPSSTPGTPPPTQQQNEDAYARGAERAKAMIGKSD